MPPIPERVPSTRLQELEALPRISTNPLDSQSRVVRQVEDLALSLGDEVARRRAIEDPNWWQTQDLLDDALDLLDAVRKIPGDMVFSAQVERAVPDTVASTPRLPPAHVQLAPPSPLAGV